MEGQKKETASLAAGARDTIVTGLPEPNGSGYQTRFAEPEGAEDPRPGAKGQRVVSNEGPARSR